MGGRFLAAVKRIARIKVITHPRAPAGAVGAPVDEPTHGAPAMIAVVAIGASTGGPAAVLTCCARCRRRFRCPLLFVLHIGEPFGAAFAEWLDGQSAHRVALATRRRAGGGARHRLARGAAEPASASSTARGCA